MNLLGELRPDEKDIFALLTLGVSASFSEEKYRIDGKSYCKQIFDDKGNQITHFANWDLIEKFFVSPDETKMLVYHRPDNAKAFLMTLYDLQNRKLIAEATPSWALQDVPLDEGLSHKNVGDKRRRHKIRIPQLQNAGLVTCKE